MRILTRSLVLSSVLLPLPFSQAVLAQTNTAAPTVTPAAPAEAAPPAAAPAPAAPAPAAPETKKRGGGPTLGLDPAAPQAAGRLTSPAEPAPVVAAEPSAEWKFDVTGYFRAPMRFSWGPATTTRTPRCTRDAAGESGDAAPHAAAGPGLQLHRLALHEQLRRALDRAQLPLRQRSREGDGPDRVVQPDRPGLPAAGVEPRASTRRTSRCSGPSWAAARTST